MGSLGFRRMSKRLQPSIALIAALGAIALLAACGSGSQKTTSTTVSATVASSVDPSTDNAVSANGPIPADAVALVGKIPITRANLNHWMHSMVGGDFWERFLKRAPANLVAEPPDYPACEVAARTLIAERKHRRSFTPAEVARRCRQLYVAVREQALTFLINVAWRINEGKENGITVSDAEAAEYSKQYIATKYPKAGEYATYLANHEWAPSDDLYQVKRNLLTMKLREKVTGLDSKTEETTPARLKYFSFVEGHIKKRTAETRCLSAYAVAMCSGYRGPTSSLPSPVSVLEELVGE